MATVRVRFVKQVTFTFVQDYTMPLLSTAAAHIRDLSPELRTMWAETSVAPFVEWRDDPIASPLVEVKAQAVEVKD